MTAMFRRPSEVAPADLLVLYNHPLVRRTLPLSGAPLDEAAAKRFTRGEERLWVEHGYGP